MLTSDIHIYVYSSKQMIQKLRLSGTATRCEGDCSALTLQMSKQIGLFLDPPVWRDESLLRWKLIYQSSFTPKEDKQKHYYRNTCIQKNSYSSY